MVIQIQELRFYFSCMKIGLILTVIIALEFLLLWRTAHDSLDLLFCMDWQCSDDLLNVVVSAGMVDHIKDWYNCVLFGIAKRTTIDEVVTPNVETSKISQITLCIIHEQVQHVDIGWL